MSKYKKGTKVITSDGNTVGELDRVVMNPRTQQISHLIVKKGFLFTEDKVISVNDVETSEDDELILGDHIEDWDDLLPYEEEHYVPIDRLEDVEKIQVNEQDAEVVYAYPPVHANMIWPVSYHMTEPRIARYKEINIPSGSIELEPGADVVTRDGEVVGHLERMFIDAETGFPTHFLVSSGILFRTRKLIPAIWVDIATDESIKLFVSSDLLKTLPDYADEKEAALGS